MSTEATISDWIASVARRPVRSVERVGYGASRATFVAEIDGAVARANETLARIESVRKHTILPVHWTPGGAELTNTQKLRRKVIAERFATEIDALFA